MKCCVETEKYRFEYAESETDAALLWESHCHAEYEMIGVLEGDITLSAEGKRYRLTKNEVAILPPLCYHTVSANKEGRYRRMTALFPASSVPDALRHSVSSLGAGVFFSPHLEKMKNICEANDTVFYAPLLEALAVEDLYAYTENPGHTAEGETDGFLEKAIIYIDRNLSEKISLSDLARLTSRSNSSFSHLFTEKMQISPKQYILKKRLAFAEKLIQSGTPPTVAAARSGYENYARFYRLYVKFYRKTPSKKN